MSNQLKFVPATGIWRWICKRNDFAAIFMPWKTVYVVEDSEVMRAHELVHAEQVDRDGAIMFSVKWLWWTMTRGYWNNPYEIEAFKVSHGYEPDGQAGEVLPDLHRNR